jgi:Na+-driven multidrug efflux pump
MLREDLQLVLGISVQQVSLALMLNIAVMLVGLIGTDALAIASVIGTLSLPSLYLGIGYGIATGSFLAKAFSEKRSEDAKRYSTMALQQVAGISFFIASCLWFYAVPIRHWFFSEASLFEASKIPIRLLAGLYLVDGIACTLQRFHFVGDGLKSSFRIMTVVQYGMFLPFALAAIHFFQISYPVYLLFHIGQRTLITVLLYRSWNRRVG